MPCLATMINNTACKYSGVAMPMVNFQNLNFLIFYPIFMQFLQNDRLYGLFYFLKVGLKGALIPKFCISEEKYMEFIFLI